METSQRNCCATGYSTIERHSWSIPRVQEDILNLTPRLSYHNPVINIDRRLRNTKSFSSHDDKSMHISSTSVSSRENSVMKSVPELVKEISTLETEVINMERYLLSLYRTTFDRYLLSSPSSASHISQTPSECKEQSIRQEVELHKVHKLYDNMEPDQFDNNSCHYKSIRRSERASFNARHIRKFAAEDIESSETKNAKTGNISGHNSLIYHLGASITDHVPQICCKLSEDIIRCISAIYCKLANLPNQNVETLTSPTTSASSSSTFSALDTCDNWSPKCHSEASPSPRKFQLCKFDNSPYNGMIEVPRICIDGERFDYASKRLHIFRSLIRQLEKIDPRKMKQEEQLAFWINIHNALVMHALLAYGLRDNHIKSRYAIQKAAYNVGGHSVDAYLIQNSILRCQTHHSSLWLGKLFSPKVKLRAASVKHQYALDHPEPLVHFALCSGASSDPALRAYTAKSIHQNLELSKAQFIQANVSVCNDSKIILPRVLQIYAKDACLELPDLLKMVCDQMPEVKRKNIERCYKRRSEKCVEWSPYKSSFRYILHPDLAKA